MCRAVRHRPHVGPVRAAVAGQLTTDHRLVPADQPADLGVGATAQHRDRDRRAVLTAQGPARARWVIWARASWHAGGCGTGQATGTTELDLWSHKPRGSPPRRRGVRRHADKPCRPHQRNTTAYQLEELLPRLIREQLRQRRTPISQRCLDRWTPPGPQGQALPDKYGVGWLLGVRTTASGTARLFAHDEQEGLSGTPHACGELSRHHSRFRLNARDTVSVTKLPVLFVSDLVVLPGMVVPLELDESSRAAIDAARAGSD